MALTLYIGKTNPIWEGMDDRRWHHIISNLEQVLATKGATSSALSVAHPLYGMYVQTVERMAEEGLLTRNQRKDLKRIGYEIKGSSKVTPLR